MTAHLLSLCEAAAICDDLRRLPQPVDVVIRVCGRQVHVYPQRCTTAVEEVAILRPVIGCTDARVFWHEWVAA